MIAQIEISKYLIPFLDRFVIVVLPFEECVDFFFVQPTISVNVHVQKHFFNPNTTLTANLLVTQIPIDQPTQVVYLTQITQSLD